MGGAVSAGEDNDELIDNLVEAEYIKTPFVERVFRAVDRGDYYLDGCKENAYRDLAWKHGNIHLSAPCIYSEVMESLKFEPGMSFLNLGSGTGYLSTMAGLVLGAYGVNHGIELHGEVVDYANAKLEEFQANSPAMDKYEFCAPYFYIGNCLLLDSTCQQYDRVYCGASCPPEHENYMKNLVRVGGVLVMPLNDHLLQITRTGETTFEVKNVLPVSFASLVTPHPSEAQSFIKLPDKYPLRLKEICRSAIRIFLREIAETENPSLKDKKKVIPSKRRKHRRRIRKVVIPVFDDRESSMRNGNASAEDRKKRLYNDNLMCRQHSTSIIECGCAKKTCNIVNKKKPYPNSSRKIINLDNTRRAASLDDTTPKPTNSNVRVRRGSLVEPEYKAVGEDALIGLMIESMLDTSREENKHLNIINPDRCNYDRKFHERHDKERKQQELELEKEYERKWYERHNKERKLQEMEMDTSEPTTSGSQNLNSSLTEEMKSSEHEENSNSYCGHHLGNGDSGIDNVSDDSMLEESSSDPEKFDGITRQAEPSTSRSNSSECEAVCSRSTKLSNYLKRSAEENDEEEASDPQYSETRVTTNCCRKAVIFKHIDYSDVDSDDLDDFESDSGKESFPKDEETREKSDLTGYTYFMKQKIGLLPLPQYLKMYLNYSRPV